MTNYLTTPISTTHGDSPTSPTQQRGKATHHTSQLLKHLSLLLLLLVMGGGSVWGDNITIGRTIEFSATPTAYTYSNGGNSNITVTQSDGSGKTDTGKDLYYKTTSATKINATCYLNKTNNTDYTTSYTSTVYAGAQITIASGTTFTATGVTAKVAVGNNFSYRVVINNGTEDIYTSSDYTVSDYSKTTASNVDFSAALSNLQLTGNNYIRLYYWLSDGSSNKYIVPLELTLTGEATSTSTHTVTFNPGSNGACTTSSLTETSAGAGVTLPKATVNDGYKFVGWSTSSSPTSADAGVANANYKPSANTTLYAYYTALSPATVSVTGGGSYTQGSTVTLTGSATATNSGSIWSVTGVNNGQRYRWWSCDADGSNLKIISAATETYSPSTSTPGTYYYKFMCVENVDGTSGYKTTYSDVVTVTVTPIYTVTFNAGSNGTCGTSSLTETSTGGGVTLPTATPNSGYAFTGWFNSSNIRMGGANDTYTPTANETLTAHYAQTSGTTLGEASGTVAFDTEATRTSTTTMNSDDTWKFTFNSYGRPKYLKANSSFDETWMNWVFVAGNYYARADNWTWISGNSGKNGSLSGDWNSYLTALENGAPVEIIAKYTGSAVEITGKTTYGGSTYTVSCNSSDNTGTLTSGSSLSAYLTLQNAYITNYTATLMPTITFDANGGTGTMTAQIVDNNVATALSANTFTRAGYNFVGWATSSDGEKVYNNGGNITLSANTTLYAKWEQANSITITAQPTGATYTQFATPTALSVTATVGTGTCTYQWQSSTNNSDFSNISNATSATYTPATTAVGTLYYRCVVSATDCESVTSNVATITVNGGSSTVNDLTQITPPYTYTPSAALPYGTLTADNNVISAAGGNDYKSGYGLNFKNNRYIAIKVPANVIISVKAGNHGTNGERTIWLGNATGSDANLQNLATLAVASGATGTLTYTTTSAGVVYISASADLYLKELRVSNGYTVTCNFNGHCKDLEYYHNQTNIADPLPTPSADGYTFVGWFNDAALTSAVVPGATLTDNVEIYAKWTINKGYTIPFDGNGITVTEDHLVEPQRGMGVTLPTAYETVTDIDIPANEEANWTFASSVSGKGLYKETIREAYFNISVPAGNVLTQQVTGLAAGKYEVVLDVAASATNLRDFKTEGAALPTGNNLTQAFASSGSNEVAKYIPVLDRTQISLNNNEYDRIALVVNVAEGGTLTYGIKNTAASGNWYLCRVHSIKKVDDTNFTGWNTKADGTGTSYTAGSNLSPEYNGTILYAQWNKTYTFRPVASNGTLVSVTVNGNTVSATNNHDITVPEKAAIVMTVTPSSGYKFKNWVLSSGGTAGAESTSNSNYIYTISSITANTTVTAKFEALGTGTDPNPANGTLSDAAVTINSFPASYAGNVQQINLGLPSGATAVVKTDDTGLNASITDGVLSIKAPTAPTTDGTTNSASITIIVTAEDGKTKKEYTVTVSTAKGNEYSYTVKAVESSTLIKEIASGVYPEGTGSITVYYPQHILKGTSLYELSRGTDTDGGWYRKVFTPNADNYTVSIAKKAKVEDVVYYTEAENIHGFTATTDNTTRASNGAAARSASADCYTTTLKKGTYKIVARGVNGNNTERLATFKANGTTVFEFHITASNNDVTGNQTFTITEDNTDITVSSSGSSSSGLDWFYIQDLGVLPVTTDGQVEYLTKTNCDNHSYFTYSTEAWKDGTFEGVTDKFFDMKTSNSRSITLNTNGALAFEVFTSGGSGRGCNVKVGNGSEVSYVKTTNGIESTGIITTGSSSNDVTIKITGYDNNTVYPVKVVFYTKPMLNELAHTIKMGKTGQVANLTATSGTISMNAQTTASQAYVTASFNATTGELSLTPVKTGIAKLSFTITDGAIVNNVEYTVNVVKQIPTITYLANNKEVYSAKADAENDFTSPTAVVKDEDGTEVTSQVSLIYISDDETLVKFNGSTASLIPNIQGSAKLKCVLYNSDIYENAMATFTVSISAGIDKKLYHLTDGKKVGEDVPAINTKLVATDDAGNTVMSMIYGGYKYGTYTHFGDKGKINDSWKGDKGTDTQFNAYGGQGTDIYGNRLDNEIDDYGFQTQAQYDSRDEYNKGIEWFKTTDVKTDGSTHYKEYERIKPFSLPCKGAYLKFEAEVNGTLTAYVLQNGNVTFSSEEGMRDKPKAGDALGGNPRIYYWFNQDGYRIAPTSFTSKQPLTIGRDYNADVVTELKEWCNRSEYSGLSTYLQDDAGWPTQAKVDANLQKPVPDPQPVVRFHEGYMVAQKAYVKYVIPVVAGETYYFFSNNSKVGVAGYNFLPDEDGTVNLILPEGGNLNANTNEGTKALNTTSDNATTHKTSGSIEMYKTVTLPRQFKKNTWSTICLPFHVTETQVEKVFGKGTNLIIYNGCAQIGGHNTARFQKHVNQDILAGQPYLIYPTGEEVEGITNEYIGGDGTNITGLTFHNVNFTPNVAVQSYASDKDGTLGADGYGTEDPDYKFIGTLGQTTVNKYDYYINNKTGKLTRYTGSGTTLNAYYGYLKNTAETPSSAKAISALSFENFEEEEEDIPTGLLEVLINDMGINIAPVDGVYNLSGQKVADSTENLPKGIYIVNGKKVSIK